MRAVSLIASPSSVSPATGRWCARSNRTISASRCASSREARPFATAPVHDLERDPHRVVAERDRDGQVDREGMAGALCRCMTYYRVQAAIKRAAAVMSGKGDVA